MTQAPLILVSNSIKQQKDTPEQCDDGPRKDYLEIARRVRGILHGYNSFDAVWYRQVRQLEQWIKLDLLEAFMALRHHPNCDAVLSTSEKLAIPVAALLKIRRQQIPHVVIAHKLSSGSKNHLFRLWHLQKNFSQIISVCRPQVAYAVNHLAVPKERAHFVYDHVDHRFFRPLPVDTEDYILTVGQEQRDYETLLRAVAGTGLKLVVVASSPWSTSRTAPIDNDNRVTVLSHIPYRELRALYARARVVVVPLFDVDYAAGVHPVLEGMAMAKPLIVSRTRGIGDYVAHGETGMYVEPGDAAALRDAILSLWNSPRKQARLGANARQMVEEQANLDVYVEQVAAILYQSMASRATA